jgi:bifunctional NMN adenylyltransferase/nudix hydrolase
MIRGCFDEEDNSRITVRYVRDYPYCNPRWLSEVKKCASGVRGGEKVGIIGFRKDASSKYLSWFRGWEFIDTESFSQGVSATEIRQSYFLEGVDWDKVEPHRRMSLSEFFSSNIVKSVRGNSYPWREHVPSWVAAYLEEFRLRNKDRYLNWVDEWVHVLKRKALSERYPYHIIYNTADAVVTKGDYILLVRRGRNPGKGLYALPGGHIDADETEFEAAVRELLEETRISFPGAPSDPGERLRYNRQEIIKCYNGDSFPFDDPWRSVLGRVITRAFHFELPEEDGDGFFPTVQGGDDAAEALWVSRADFPALEDKMFDDHWDIVNHFLNQTSKKWR